MLTITDKEFSLIKDIMYKNTGVDLKPTKKPLVSSRLRRRLEALNCQTFTDYIHVIEKPSSPEMEYFVNAITTNETFFFRHTKQFNYLYEVILPGFFNQGIKKLQVWSAASSTGEEPYSIAIALTEFAKKHPGFDFTVFASDVNTIVLEAAQEGQYEERSLKEAPPSLREKYFTKIQSDPKEAALYAVSATIKQKVQYFQHNLMHMPQKTGMHVVFLRNALIYFDRTSKQKVVELVEKALLPGGYFFVSLSENLYDVTSSLTLINSCIFQKK